MSKTKIDYKKMTVDDMVNYILEKDNTKESAKFIKGFYEDKPKDTKLVVKKDSNGNPITYIDKNGKEKYRKVRVATTKETKKVYNVLAAKVAFYEKYKDDIEFINAPEKKKKDEPNDKIASALARLG